MASGSESNGAKSRERLPTQVEMMEQMLNSGAMAGYKGPPPASLAPPFSRDRDASPRAASGGDPTSTSSSSSSGSSSNGGGGSSCSSSNGGGGGGGDTAQVQVQGEGQGQGEMVVLDYSLLFNQARSAKSKGRSSMVPRYGVEQNANLESLPSRKVELYIPPPSSPPRQRRRSSILWCFAQPDTIA